MVTPPTKGGLPPLHSPESIPLPSKGREKAKPGSPGPMEVELAAAIVAAAERASELAVRVGMADGKFAAYVAAVLGERGQRTGYRGDAGTRRRGDTGFDSAQPEPVEGRVAEPPLLRVNSPIPRPLPPDPQLGRRPHPHPLPEGEGVYPRPSPRIGGGVGVGASVPYPLSSVPRVAPVTCHLSPVTSIVPPGSGAAFLADLSIEDLPVSPEMKRRLRLFGLRTLGELGQLPQSAVLAQFRSEGARAWELAHGIDRTPIIPYVPPKSVTERLAFVAPVDTAGALLAAVRTLLGRALHQPTTRGRAARALRLRVHLENGHTWEREATFREPVGGSERMLLALRLKIDGAELPAPFTEVELTLLGLCGENALQLNLFTSERSRQLGRVAEAARQLKSRYGRPILAKVIEVEPWSRIPERRFALIDYDP